LKRFGYQVDARLLNARDYGAPQNRERVVVVAHRGDWEWPEPAVAEPVAAGIAIGDTAHTAPDDAKFLTDSMDRYIADYERRSHCVTPRDLHLDRPARTLTCRNFGGATSDMQRVRLPDGRRRMLTVRGGRKTPRFSRLVSVCGQPLQANRKRRVTPHVHSAWQASNACLGENNAAHPPPTR